MPTGMSDRQKTRLDLYRRYGIISTIVVIKITMTVTTITVMTMIITVTDNYTHRDVGPPEDKAGPVQTLWYYLHHRRHQDHYDCHYYYCNDDDYNRH